MWTSTLEVFSCISANTLCSASNISRSILSQKCLQYCGFSGLSITKQRHVLYIKKTYSTLDLAQQPRLRELTLRDNHIDYNATHVLLDTLEAIQTVRTVVDLTANDLEDDGDVQEFMEANQDRRFVQYACEYR